MTGNKIYPCLGWILLLLFLNQNSVYAQEWGTHSSPGSLKSLGNTIGSDVTHVATSPFRITPKDATKLIGFATLTVGFILVLDNAADDEFGQENHVALLSPLQTAAEVGKAYDNVGPQSVFIGLSAAMLTTGLIFKDKKLLNTTYLMAMSVVISEAITFVGKSLFSRSRPYMEEGPKAFNTFSFSGANDYNSFPSGHTSGAFAMMTVIAKQYNQWYIKFPAYFLATSVALQRMDSRSHWASDVFVGGAIGYLVGSTLVNKHHKKATDVSFNPYFSGNRVGLNIKF